MQLPAMWLTIALGAYVAGMAGALLSQRARRFANVFGFSLAAFGGACGVAFSVSSLSAGKAAVIAPVTLWTSAIPGVRLVVEADALSCFFVLIVSLVGLAI